MSSVPPLKLAKMHLGLPENSSHALVPPEYLDELFLHVAMCPKDTKFKLSSQPHRGFGKVTCLEEGCNCIEIELQRNSRLPDGGRKTGIGSLSAYRTHIAQHPKHRQSCLVRVKAEANDLASSGSTPKKGKTVKKEPSVIDLRSIRVPQPSSSPDRPRNTFPSRQSQESCSSPVKEEPQENVFESPDSVPPSPSPAFQSSSPSIRKRSPSLDFDVLSSPTPSGSALPPAKRIKTELTRRAPLGVSTNTVALAPTVASSPAMNHSAIDASDAREQIDNLKRETFYKQDLLDSLLRKDKLSAADLTCIQEYVDELETLHLLKNEFESSLLVMSPVKRTSSVVKSESNHSFYEHAEAGPSRLSRYASTLKGEQTPSGPLAFSSDASTSLYPKPSMTQLPPVAPSTAAVVAKLQAPPHFPPRPQLNAVTGSSNQVQHAAYDPPGHFLHNPFLNDGDYEDEDEDEDAAMGYADTIQNPKANAVAMQFAGSYIPNVAAMVQDDHNYDEEGNYHGRGKDHFQGPVANADDIEKFLVEAGNAECFDNNATVDGALKKLGLPSLFTPLPGMEVALMAHQVIGVAWMAEKETSYLKGGCLADEMGLGKTVQLIALMMKNKPDDQICKTTLILAPTALLDQWRMEIEVKTSVDLKVLIYHGSSKPKRAKEILNYDVVLTTFQTMALEWPDIEQQERKKKKAKAQPDDLIVDSCNENMPKKTKKKEAGLLFQIEFHRIVLDEAQGIKNKKTRVSRAVTALKAKYRWCLTGTPIINGLSDTYPYIRYLRIRPWYDFSEFHSQVGKLEKKNPQLAITRLQAILNTFVLRRKKSSKLDGKVLVDLPPKEITLQHLEFTEEEREIYDAVEKRMQTQFNQFLQAGTVLKNYHHVLVLLLRLRQCCVHPSLIQEEGIAFVAPDELDSAGRVLKRARELVSPEFVTKVKTKFREALLERMRVEKESEDATFETDDCPICYDSYTNAVITSCGHSFCKECIFDVFNTPLVGPTNEPRGYQATERPCPACRSPISKDLLFEQAAFMPTDEELKETSAQVKISDVETVDVATKNRTKGKARSRASLNRKTKMKTQRSIILDSDDIIDVDAIHTGLEAEDEDDHKDDDDNFSDFIVESDEDEEEKEECKALKKRLGKRKATIIFDSDEEETDEEEKRIIFGKRRAKELSSEAIKLLPKFLPSTKMKILVVSQWTSCLTLVSQYLTEKDVLHVKYQGDMNRTKRNAAVRSFMSKDKARVMLMSLKCGGVGLNLTRANNVISLDLGWSQATEDQAFDRVHRLGQLLPVKVQRLVVEHTIEDRMLKMQERKQILADGSLGEGTAKKIQKMTVKQLAELFGLDGRGRLLDDGNPKQKVQA
ncbi:SNF2 superfamily protein [Lentinula aciculospora]|uniref:SNF2 superfamily protein n=1 Tax=Lentinula aciculospora TaxID=153920 RepID=A0A9W9DGU0_9AGAR|nr:SNF2 superfamily protein [Lentinula aciculospora]